MLEVTKRIRARKGERVEKPKPVNSTKYRNKTQRFSGDNLWSKSPSDKFAQENLDFTLW